ncbi:MAG TPA: hypothetical protein EYP19_03215, partial [Desulfobacterales bacterium]|nr:hypothetical protein [Desulfobacterales bacterium]
MSKIGTFGSGWVSTLAVFFLVVSFGFLIMLSTSPGVSAYTITVDGDPSDWLADSSGQENNTGQVYTNNGWEFVWKDNVDDDVGDGDYTYPTHENFGTENNLFDLLEWRMTVDNDNVYFLFKMENLAQVFGAAGANQNGFSGTAFVICIDNDRVAGSGQEWLPAHSDARTADVARWERAIYFDGNDA